ncbi:MAG: MFS transporter [Pseudoclavibacter sp.]|nr:MFS transporter [Pseudoclavibacter sp.]
MRTPTQTPPAPASRAAERLPLLPLIALAAATFVSITIEMLPTAVMPVMAADLGVSSARVGMLMTVFAATVVITSAPLTHLTARVPRHALLTGVLLLYGLSTAATALAPDYGLILAGRIAGGLAHGVFWAIAASYTARIVPEAVLARALSITIGGGSAAFVLGVPLSALLAQAIGWRATFGALAALTLAIAALLWWRLPRAPGAAAAGPAEHRAEEIAATAPTGTVAPPEPGAGSAPPGRPGRSRSSMRVALLVCGLACLIMTGQYAAASYVSPLLVELAGLPLGLLGAALLVYGAAGAAATFATGHAFGSRPRLGLFLSLGLMAAGVGLVALAGAAGAPWLSLPGLVVWGAGTGFVAPLLQTRLLSAAPEHRRDVASALYTSGFNIGIAGGALLGGLLLETAGVAWLPPFFLAVTALSAAAAAALDRAAARGGR